MGCAPSAFTKSKFFKQPVNSIRQTAFGSASISSFLLNSTAIKEY